MEILLGILLIGQIVTFLLVGLLWQSIKGREKNWSQNLLPLERGLERLERATKEEMQRNRLELGQSLKNFGDFLISHMSEISQLQKNQFEVFATQLQHMDKTSRSELSQMRQTIEQQLQRLQEDNSKKLDQMRQTVDEKLHQTLEKRLGESFKLVGDRLEKVQRGLGEMQVLAAGVGDLKKVLSNVKTRGIWGEMQLSRLLEQILTPDQYAVNVATKQGSHDRVEFALKLPGREEEGATVWLPIDAKFPQEDYQRLLDAQELGQIDLAEEAAKSLEQRIKAEAKDIHDKYLDPPRTTDFGILFLPVEGLFAEVLRRPGLCEFLQREYRINVTGPTTLAALLNSLQMGFRTLAIEKRSSEVWTLLGAVKTEFGKFGDILAKTKEKLDQASRTIDSASVRSRAIERKLRGVEELPACEADSLLKVKNSCDFSET